MDLSTHFLLSALFHPARLSPQRHHRSYHTRETTQKCIMNFNWHFYWRYWNLCSGVGCCFELTDILILRYGYIWLVCNTCLTSPMRNLCALRGRFVCDAVFSTFWNSIVMYRDGCFDLQNVMFGYYYTLNTLYYIIQRKRSHFAFER